MSAQNAAVSYRLWIAASLRHVRIDAIMLSRASPSRSSSSSLASTLVSHSRERELVPVPGGLGRVQRPRILFAVPRLSGVRAGDTCDMLMLPCSAEERKAARPLDGDMIDTSL